MATRRARLAVLATLALAAFALAPALETGFAHDDVISSIAPGLVAYTGVGHAGRITMLIRASMLDGRFFPLVWPLFHLMFLVGGRVAVYKALILAGVLVDLALFFALVRRVAGDPRLAALATATTVGLFQFRLFADPILAFHGLMQVVAAGTFGSLLLLQLHLDGRRGPWRALSVATYLGCLLIYEITYAFLPLHLLLIARARPGWRERAALAWPYARALAACVVVSSLLRWLHYTRAEAAHIHLDPAAFLRALTWQTSAALPLSYLTLAGAPTLPTAVGPLALLRWAASPSALAVGAGSGLIALALLARRPDADEATPSRPWAFGLFLAILPGVMVALSSGYQRTIGPGKGYLPAYLQCFGVGLLLATAARSLAGCRGFSWSRFAAAALLAITAGLTYRANAAVAEVYRELDAPRRNIETALRGGLLDDVPPYAVVLLEHEYPGWHDAMSPFFYRQHAGKVLATVPPSARSPSSPGWSQHDIFLRANPHLSARPPGPSTPRYWLADVPMGPRAGYVLLARLDDAGAGRALRVFVRHPAGSRGAFRLHADTAAGVLERPGSALATLRRGPGWGLFALRPDAAPIRPASAWLSFPAARSRRQLARTDGRPRS